MITRDDLSKIHCGCPDPPTIKRLSMTYEEKSVKIPTTSTSLQEECRVRIGQAQRDQMLKE